MTPNEFYCAWQQYLETALWASCDDDGNPLEDSFFLSDFLQAQSERETLSDFLQHPTVLEIAKRDSWGSDQYERAACDFWLSRNRHGAGFWDGGFWTEDTGEILHDVAKTYGSCDVMIGDDGFLFFC
jgi:hypothetical protein